MFKLASQQLKKPFRATSNAKSNPRARNAVHLQVPWVNDEAQHLNYLSATEANAILYWQSPTFCENLAVSLREMTESRILREYACYYGDMNQSLRSQKSVVVSSPFLKDDKMTWEIFAETVECEIERSLLYPDQPVDESHIMAKQQLARTARILKVSLDTLRFEMADFLADLRDPNHDELPPTPIIEISDELSRMKRDRVLVEKMFINDRSTQQSLIQLINRMILVHSPLQQQTYVAAGEGGGNPCEEEGIRLWVQAQKRMQRSMHPFRKYDMPRWMMLGHGAADVKKNIDDLQSYISGADAAQKRQELEDKTAKDLGEYTKRVKEAEERKEALRRLKQQMLGGRLKRSKNK